MDLPSKYLQNAVDQFAVLPGIGRKSALRLALFLLRQDKRDIETFIEAFREMNEHIRFCEKCGNVSDSDLCGICSDTKRQHQMICVVEDLRDILAIENTGQYSGVYHVLGGNISPMEGIGPDDLNIPALLSRAESREIEEVILALSTTMEGDSTNFYLYKKLEKYNVKVSTIARGVAVGDALEYTDEITLGRSIVNRTPYESSISG